MARMVQFEKTEAWQEAQVARDLLRRAPKQKPQRFDADVAARADRVKPGESWLAAMGYTEARK